MYSLQHSFFASIRIKKLFRKYLPKFFTLYRLIYTIMQAFLFILLWIIVPKPADIIWNLSGIWYWLFRIIQGLAFIGLLLAFSDFSLKEFTGMAGLDRFLSNQSPVYDDEIYQLNRSGMYAISRHPIYFFTLLIFLFRPYMTLFDLLVFIWLVVYFHIGSIWEERRMETVFPKEYAEYKRQVSRIIPLLYLQRRLGAVMRAIID